MVEKSGADVLALLADEVPNGPRRCDLITLQEFAQCLSKALTTESKELTEPLAGIFLIKALAGVLEYTNTPSGRLSVYVINEYYNRRLGDKKRVPTDEDLEDYQAACRAGHYMEKPRVKVSERTETINHLIKSYKSHFSDVKIGDINPNQYPGDVLAVVREDAFKAFGLASFLEQPLPDRAPPAVQSEPAPEEPASPAHSVVKSSSSRRKGALSAVLCRARQEATEPTCPHSVWAALVNLAQGKNPPPELTDYHPKNGIQATGTRTGWLTKAAFMERWRRGDV
jgi:hypothetical protein